MAPRKKTLSVLQWNCRSRRGKIPELSKKAEKFDVILIRETWLKETDRVYLKDFDVIRKDRVEHNGGGTAIFIRKDIEYEIIEHVHDCAGKVEICAILVELENEDLLLMSCYKPPGKRISKVEWLRFFEAIKRHNRFIITGDFNAHHTWWGSDHVCAEGEGMNEAMEKMEMVLLNDGTPTFISHAYGTESCSDLTITDDSSVLLCEWKVLEDGWGSDHFPIQVEMGIPPKYVENIGANTRIYSNNKMQWDLFSETIEKAVQNDEILNSQAAVTEKYTSIVNLIKDCALEASKYWKKKIEMTWEKTKQ